MSLDQPAVEPLFTEAKKFREIAADKFTYTLSGFTLDKQNLLTVQSTLPSPRKGNPGTLKTSLNFRKQVTLDAGLSTERTAPIVIKVDMSFPLGATVADKDVVRAYLAKLANVSDTTVNELVYNGILPQD